MSRRFVGTPVVPVAGRSNALDEQVHALALSVRLTSSATDATTTPAHLTLLASHESGPTRAVDDWRAVTPARRQHITFTRLRGYALISGRSIYSRDASPPGSVSTLSDH